MFTGIVEELGRIVRVPSPSRAGQLEIAATRVLAGTNVGDSIAVNGVCLTATTVSAAGFTADVMPQTLAHSNLGALRAGSPVNLERAMAADGRFGGHIVSGHIDGTGTIRRIRRDQNAVRFAIEAPASIMALIVQRGSVAIDGISLTVAELAADAFEVSIIPHTIEQTTLSHRKPGDAVNLENDVVGKYVQRLLHGACTTPAEHEAANASASPSPLSLSYLSAHGF